MAEFEADLKDVEWAEYGTPEMRELYDYIGIDMPDWETEGCVSLRCESRPEALTFRCTGGMTVIVLGPPSE
jgi:hypothetical protein